MQTFTDGRCQSQISFLRRQFLQGDDLPFGEVLSKKAVSQALATSGVVWKQRVYSPLVTLWVFLGQGLSADHSCRSAVARLIAHRVAQGESMCSAETGAYCQARKRLAEKFFSTVARLVGRELDAQAPSDWLWKGRRVHLFDGSTVSMPDTPANQDAYPQHDAQRPGLGFPIALRDAVEKRRPRHGELLHHSDRGCQYTSDGYQKTLRTLGIEVSMSRTGNCYDNAVAERFFWSLKHEWTNWRAHATMDEARLSVFRYIETFYNSRRRHQTLGYKFPPRRCPKVLGYRTPTSSTLTGAEALGDWTTDAPGVRRKITVEDLARPYATPSAQNHPRIVDRPEGAWPQAPAGFEVTEFATGLEEPRVIRRAPNGDLFVAESRADRIRILRDTDGDGKPEVNQVFATGLKRPFGIAFYPVGSEPEFIYVGNTDSVVRFPYKNGDTK
ncbi:nisX1, partial [Symbiodinium sp. CCMP2456]